MKNDDWSKCFLRVREEKWEAPADTSKFYEGIFCVYLAPTAPIAFVPEFPRDHANWPPVLPENTDALSTEDDARRVTVLLNNFTVTPGDPTKSPEHLALPPVHFDGQPIRFESNIWYVGEDVFQQFSRELADFVENIGESPANACFDRAFVRFIFNNIVGSNPWQKRNPSMNTK